MRKKLISCDKWVLKGERKKQNSVWHMKSMSYVGTVQLRARKFKKIKNPIGPWGIEHANIKYNVSISFVLMSSKMYNPFISED